MGIEDRQFERDPYNINMSDQISERTTATEQPLLTNSPEDWDPLTSLTYLSGVVKYHHNVIEGDKGDKRSQEALHIALANVNKALGAQLFPEKMVIEILQFGNTLALQLLETQLAQASTIIPLETPKPLSQAA